MVQKVFQADLAPKMTSTIWCCDLMIINKVSEARNMVSDDRNKVSDPRNNVFDTRKKLFRPGNTRIREAGDREGSGGVGGGCGSPPRLNRRSIGVCGLGLPPL